MNFLLWVGDFIRTQLMRVPLGVARWFFLGLLLALMGWVVQLPGSQATPLGRKCEWYEDLRIWAWLALMIQIVIYSVF